MRSIKEECLDKMIPIGERHLRQAIHEFVEHYHRERNHQGLGNRLIQASDGVGDARGEIACRQRLGGMLSYYHRKAA